jgi:hypothetical protein
MCVLGDHRKADMFSTQKNGGLTVREYYEIIADKAEIEKSYWNSFEENNYDVLILPPLGVPAPHHQRVVELLPSFSYCFLANVIHWPSGYLYIYLYIYIYIYPYTFVYVISFLYHIYIFFYKNLSIHLSIPVTNFINLLLELLYILGIVPVTLIREDEQYYDKYVIYIYEWIIFI